LQAKLDAEIVQCDSDIDQLAAEVIEVCKARNWSLHWTARGAYLHLEASELIEAIRGKGNSTPQAEAADVLIVLMSITQNAGIRFSGVVNAAKATLQMLRMKPPYKGEERTDGRADELAAALAE
jgi:NTP pyrophosphatase (non-canonical NTP hydrolase)